MSRLYAGAAAIKITPIDSQFLFGYPHVERYSTGVHDALWASALYMTDGDSKVLFIANDIILISKAMTKRLRQQIENATSIPAGNIMVTATHTHSGPKTFDYLCNEDDPTVPTVDLNYVRFMEKHIVEAAKKAYKSAQPAKIGLAVADGTGVGTNRRDPSGPADPQVPVLMVKSFDGKQNIAVMVVYSMHPTVLHEDSTLISGDFPAMTREYLQENVVGKDCPVVYHTGPEGNQSPRHVTKSNTFEEAKRLGVMLGKAIKNSISQTLYTTEVKLSCCQEYIELPRRAFPSVEQAGKKLARVIKKLEKLRSNNSPRPEIRTAECDWFGAEETLTLAKAALDGRMEAVFDSCMPAEIQIIKVGKWTFVGWQGEMFIEFSLKVKQAAPNTFLIALANGEFQGYIVTPEAAVEGGYEASCALFSHQGGQILVDKTLQALAEL